MAKIPTKQIIGLNDKFSFGKYKGFTLDDVLTIDPRHVRWCVEDACNIEMTNEAYKEYEQVKKNKGL